MITTAVTEQTTEAAPVSRTDPEDYSNPAPAEPPSDGKPTWWREALALEAKGELSAAEKRIEDGCPHMSFAYCIADMYRMRMLRLMNAGDKSGAHEAFRKSSSFIFYYASMATSGGEGAALSVERDEFRARLVREYGSDPEAR
jgi:hypothetical protein